MDLNPYREQLSPFLVEAIVALSIFLTLFVTQFILQRLLSTMARKLEPNQHAWKLALFTALKRPLRYGIWVAGIMIIIKMFPFEPKYASLPQLISSALSLGLVAIVAWFLILFSLHAENNLKLRTLTGDEPLDPMATDLLSKLTQVAIFIAAILTGMQIIGVPISGILAFGGIGGVAVGFAAQGLVANLLGGLAVYTTRPFKIGESIIIPEDGVDGEVLSIGWRATAIMGFDRRPFYVPNSKFNTSIVINHSRLTSRRIREYIHVRYADVERIPKIVAETNEYLSQHPGIEHEFFVFNFDGYGDSTLKLFIYAFTETTDYVEFMRVKEEILLHIAGIIRKHGAELAVPASTIQVPEGIQIHASNG